MDAVNAAIRSLNTCGGCGLSLPCGMGKTIIACYLMAKLGRKAIVLVHTVQLAEQWVERIKLALGDDVRVGRVQGKTVDLDAPIVVPSCVIDELHRLSDSSDRLKRERGRRGMSNLRSLQQLPEIKLTIEELESEDGMVDQTLMDHAEKNQLRLVSTDSNMLRVAEIRRIMTLNLHDLSVVMQASANPGDRLVLEIIRPGESPGQGIAYLPDGTMVVIEEAGDAIGEVVEAVITNTLQTSAGRMVFAKAAGEDDGH